MFGCIESTAEGEVRWGGVALVIWEDLMVFRCSVPHQENENQGKKRGNTKIKTQSNDPNCADSLQESAVLYAETGKQN